MKNVTFDGFNFTIDGGVLTASTVKNLPKNATATTKEVATIVEANNELDTGLTL